MRTNSMWRNTVQISCEYYAENPDGFLMQVSTETLSEETHTRLMLLPHVHCDEAGLPTLLETFRGKSP